MTEHSPADDTSIDHDDLASEDTLRIERRLADGVYRILHGEQQVGEENWAILSLKGGGYRVMTELHLDWPKTHQQRAELDTDANWNPLGLWVEIDINGKRRSATYLVEQGNVLDVRITEQKLPANEDTAGGRGRTRPAPPPKTVLARSYGFDPEANFDFASALFNFVILQRLKLSVGRTGMFESVVVSLPTLEPIAVQQSYAYVRDEPLDRETGQGLARRYTIREMDGEEAVTTFWTDERGLVIRQSVVVDGEPHGCEMAEYRWNE